MPYFRRSIQKYLRMNLIHLIALVSSVGFGPFGGGDSVAIARRLSASAHLAAQEYRLGVANGVITDSAEVSEARLFLGEAKRSAALLPASLAGATVKELDQILAMVNGLASPDSIGARVSMLTARIAATLRIQLDEVPSNPPSLARGAEVYRRECAACHGERGVGDGLAGRGLQPPPANLTDLAALTDATPLDFYRRVTIGVAGTAMPAYETRLSPTDRWAVALYATTLRDAAPNGVVPPSLQDFTVTAGLTDGALLDSLGTGATRAHLAAVRAWQAPNAEGAATAAIFDSVRNRVSAATALALRGQNDSAVTAASDAYLVFEGVESAVRAKEPGLAGQVEAGFATLRTRVAGGATRSELESVEHDLASLLENAERAVADRMSPLNLFLQSLVILLREGLEAILIIGALIAFLDRTGASHRKRDVHIGVGAAVAMSLLTAALLETVFVLSSAHREALEGFTMILAVGVLFYVSYWLLSKMEVARWSAFVKERLQVAVTGGSAFALASAAFLAVYREGFETVLFYQALLVSGGSIGGTLLPVVLGIVAGGILLAIVYVAINRWGVRLPLRPFFGATSAFLYYMAFVFAGKGVAELQAGRVLPTTMLIGWPRVPALGIYPTLESVTAQGILVALAVFALAWFIVRRRREPVPAMAAATADPVPPAPVLEAAPDGEVEKLVLRSLEQMDADLSALRQEVERLRSSVTDASADKVAKP